MHSFIFAENRRTAFLPPLLWVLIVFGLVPAGFGAAPIHVLKHVEEQWSSHEQMQVDLWQSVTELHSGHSTHYAGALYVLRGKDLRLDYEKLAPGRIPPVTAVTAWVQSASFTPQHIYLAKSDVMLHFDYESDILTKEYMESAGLPPILQSLSGVREFREKEFRDNHEIQPITEEKVFGHDTYKIEFRPQGPQKEFQVRYELWVDRKNYIPVRLLVKSRDETVDIGFFNFRTDDPLPENIFELTLSPGMQFIDRTVSLE